ncbi:MAG: response regulator [Bdellovibrionota bacterium]
MKTVLIVDDQNSVLLTLDAILKKEGFIVVACTNSLDAYENIQREKFDVVITDAVMPMGTSGFSLISTIRSQPNINTKVPILMLTGKRDPADVEKAIAVGANDYMIKPIDPDVLMQKLKKLLVQSNEQDDFVSATVNKPASLPMEITITTTSEISVKFSSDVGFIPGQIYKISSDFFNIFEKTTVSIRVNTSELKKDHYIVSANYVGLSEIELSHIRTWIRNKLIQEKK